MAKNANSETDASEIVEEKPDKRPRLIDPVEKSAILLMSIGEKDAAAVLKHLGPKEVQRIGVAMSSLESVSADEVSEISDQFIKDTIDQTGLGLGANDYLKNTLVEALGADRANTLLDRIVMGGSTQGLDTLKWMDARAVAGLIRYEHPQIQAIVVAYLDADQSCEVIKLLPENMRHEIIVRVANLDTILPQAIQELNDILERQFYMQASAASTAMGGTKVAANIMNFLDSSIEAEIIEAIRSDDEELAGRIEELMFVFENLANVDDRAIQAILKEVSADTLVIALKGSDEDIKEKIFSNMSSRAADLLRDDLEAKGPVRISDVESAQKEILATARRLSEAGEIILDSGSDPMI